jgi:DNA repair protein RadC
MTELIRELPRDDRPRERLFTHGPETLSNAELVAILLGSGLRGKNAIQLARELLSQGMAALKQREPKQLYAVPGVGPAKAARVAAAIELSRRVISDEPDDPPVYEATVFGQQLVTRCARYRQERLGAALLDARHRIMKEREIFVGTVNNALVSTRDILRLAVMEEASALVIYHNHPSGDPTPSKEDESFTKRLRHSLELADVDLIDHLVIGAHRYFSMKEKGMIDPPRELSRN